MNKLTSNLESSYQDLQFGIQLCVPCCNLIFDLFTSELSPLGEILEVKVNHHQRNQLGKQCVLCMSTKYGDRWMKTADNLNVCVFYLFGIAVSLTFYRVFYRLA